MTGRQTGGGLLMLWFYNPLSLHILAFIGVEKARSARRFVLCLINMFILVGFTLLISIIKESNGCGWSWRVRGTDDGLRLLWGITPTNLSFSSFLVR